MKRSSFVPVLALLITAGAAEATTHVGIISTESHDQGHTGDAQHVDGPDV